MSSNYWNLKTKVLHLGMAAAVSLQLLISLVMDAPDAKDSTSLAKAAFEAHEVVGILALLIIAGHWIVSIRDHSEQGLSHLFPWKGDAWTSVKADTKGLLNKQLPETGPRPGLPGFVHGLGLIVVSGMALTGGILFFVFPESGEPGAIAELFAEAHETIATLAWIYWLGHAGIAVVHQLSGSNTLKRMFNYN